MNNQCASDGNLNIRTNMKAGPGIKFTEGKNYVDVGPSYFVSLEAERMTLQEYKLKHVAKSEFQHRGIMSQQEAEASIHNKSEEPIFGTVRSVDHEEDKMYLDNMIRDHDTAC